MSEAVLCLFLESYISTFVFMHVLLVLCGLNLMTFVVVHCVGLFREQFKASIRLWPISK